MSPEYFDGRPVQAVMTTRQVIDLLEYLEEMRTNSRPIKQVKLSTFEIAYLVALCNADVFGRSPTPGKGESTGTNDASVNSPWTGGHTLEGSPSTPTKGDKC